MTALLVALAFPLLPAALPDAADRRYRVEIGGQLVGAATLSVRCDRARCTSVFETALRLPEAGGGGVARRRVEAVTDREGAMVAAVAGGRRRASNGDAVATILAETVLAGAGARRCIPVEDVETGRTGQACARREGAWLDGEVLGEPVRFRPGIAGLPDEVLLPAQATRFVADAAAAVPDRAPKAFGVTVPAFPGAETDPDIAFCGLSPEPVDPAPPPGGLSRDFPERGNCQEQSAAYLRSAREDGIEGRLVVGVAWDGRRFTWHEWVELAAGGRWTAVDPSFRQLPALGPRFAVARFTPGDEAARAEAGRRVLACWGKARVEQARREPRRTPQAEPGRPPHAEPGKLPSADREPLPAGR